MHFPYYHMTAEETEAAAKAMRELCGELFTRINNSNQVDWVRDRGAEMATHLRWTFHPHIRRQSARDRVKIIAGAAGFAASCLIVGIGDTVAVTFVAGSVSGGLYYALRRRFGNTSAARREPENSRISAIGRNSFAAIKRRMPARPPLQVLRLPRCLRRLENAQK